MKPFYFNGLIFSVFSNIVWYMRNKFVLLFGDLQPRLTFTCLKSTLETLERGVKYVQS